MKKSKYILGISLLVACLLVLSPLSIANTDSATGNAGNINAGKDNGTPLGTLSFLWECNLTISEPGLNSDIVSFGEATDAYDGATGPGPSGSDSYDWKHAPAPPSEPYIYAYFDDGLVGNSWEKMARDFRQGPDTQKVWNLTVEWHNSSFTYIPQMTIAWNPVELATEYTSIELWNMSGTPTMVADMLTQSSFTYTQGWIYVDPPGMYFWVPGDFEIRCTFDITCADEISEDFEGTYGVRPLLPDGWSIEDTNGDGYTSGVYAYNMWGSYSSTTYAHSGQMSVRYEYAYDNPADDWFFTECVDLVTGMPYTLSFWYRCSSSSYVEKLEIYYGSSNSSGSMTTQIVDLPSITNTEHLESVSTFTVPSDDVYYIGFHCYSATNQYNLYLDDIDLSFPKDDDVGVTSINEPTGSFLGGTYTPEATVQNFGLNDQTNVPVHMQIYKKVVTGLSEGFEGSFPPSGWTTIKYSGTGDWEQAAYGDAHTYDPGGTGVHYAIADDDEAPSGTDYDVGLFTPSIDCTSFGSSATLEFMRCFQDFAGYGQAKINTYSGGTGATDFEETLLYLDLDDSPSSGIFTQLIFDPSGYTDPSDVYVEFWYTDDSYASGAWSFSIDDVFMGSVDWVLDYDQTVNVDLLSMEIKDVTFPDWTPPVPAATDVIYKVEAQTELIGDQDPSNDGQEEEIIVGFYHDVGTVEITSPFFGGLGGKGSTFYVENLHDTIPGPGNNLCSFDSDIPGTLTVLGTSTAGDFLAGGCFVEDVWYACEYSATDSNIWQVDETDGTLTLVGASGALLNGIAYDPAGTLYGCSSTDFYTIDVSTGVATLVGAMGNPGAVMIGIACDGDGNMYGEDIGDDNLYSIDTSTGAATIIGPLGVGLSYAQDIAYDIDGDTLYSTGYKGSTAGGGGLYSIDTATGTMTFIGDFPIGNTGMGCPSECANFAIPYTIGDLPQGIAGIIPVEVIVENFGDYTETFDVKATVTKDTTLLEEFDTIVYNETVTVTGLGSGLQETVNFPDWDATGEEGNFKIEVETLLPDDDFPANDDQRYRFALIAEAPPTADANGPYYANIGNSWTVTFDGSGSHDNDGGGAPPEISSYLWDFGDGTTGTGVSPTHTYAHPEHSSQTITVTLTVWDNDVPPEQDTDTTEVIIAPSDDDPPIVQLEFPRGGEELAGTINIQWYAVDSEDWGSPSLTLKYSGNGGSSWVLIASDLENTIGDGDYKDRGEYSWSAGSLPDGNYIVRINAYDSAGNVAVDVSDPFIIGNHNSGLLVSYIAFNSVYIKNGDSLEINAGITYGQHLTAEEITADLSGFGKGASVPADSFDGLTATWTIDDVVCTPSDGSITVTVTADHESNSATITADNTIPDLTIVKPENGLYFFNSKLLTLNRPIIIGGLTVELNIQDTSGIQKTEIYIDDELKDTLTDGSEWYMNLRLMGQHTLEIVTYDNAGNTDVCSQTVRIYNLFGEK